MGESRAGACSGGGGARVGAECGGSRAGGRGLAMQWSSEYRATSNDWIWSSTDASEIAKRACELLQSSSDRQALANQQKAHVELHHTTDAMACSYYALYQAVMDRL